MSGHIDTARQPPRLIRRSATGVGGLLSCLVVLSSAGCASPRDAAQEQVMVQAEQIAHETEPWATDAHNQEGWASNQSVLDRLVSAAGGERLTAVIHNPDERGVGLLATVEVVMVGSATENWIEGAEVYYNICVRFEVRRETTGPREITAKAIDCPHGIAPAR